MSPHGRRSPGSPACPCAGSSSPSPPSWCWSSWRSGASPRSPRAYGGWTAVFEAIGAVWTAVLLAVVYVLSVGPIGLVMRLFGQDPLDRRLAPEPSFWRAHEPNPLGPERAARHQF